jgi:hypothetical protein
MQVALKKNTCLIVNKCQDEICSKKSSDIKKTPTLFNSSSAPKNLRFWRLAPVLNTLTITVKSQQKNLENNFIRGHVNVALTAQQMLNL